MDADFSHDPSMLPLLKARAEAGADLVLGSRYIDGGGTENWGRIRRLISQGGNIYARTILSITPRDLTGGYKCFRRCVLESIPLDDIHSEGYAFQIEMTYRALQHGFTIAEIPIQFSDRRVGHSKMSKRIVLEALWMVWKLKLVDPRK
jgi:dolichol-phosphate mannosyltransferase